jgi:nitric oxide reductase activation protein
VDGDELDMDAVTEAVVDRMAGAPMSDNVFIRRDKKQRDVACLFLLDMSDSTDQLVEGDRRVIDVEKEGLVLLSEALGQLDDQYAIMGFSSRGRKMVDLFVVKDFCDEFDADVAARIGGITPLDYTRLGAAIRHAVQHVGAQPAAARLLVLLSDGRPYDMGYGDMRYAMEDTKMALSEARRAGVSPFCITVDPKGPDYLEDLFGVNGYTVIQNVGHLPTKLPRIYRNLTV